MENASKALLIAGAILIVIVLIGIGVLIVNATSGMQDQAASSADAMAIRTFNSQFTAYEGEGISAAQVRSLISTMNASNGANPQHKVTVPTTAVTSGKTYTVALTYGTDGYVNGATITQKP